MKEKSNRKNKKSLKSFFGGLKIDSLIEETIFLAEAWQKRANALLTPEEKMLQNRMKRLLNHPRDKIILAKMIDQGFRTTDRRRAAGQLSDIFKQYGIPNFFSLQEKALLLLFLSIGRHLPDLSIPQIIKKMHKDSNHTIIPGEDDVLRAHLHKRKIQGVRMNINHLGEAVLSEQEALKRLDVYLEDLKDPQLEYISVKISTIYSQIQPLAFDHCVNIISDRLSRLYRAACENFFERRDGDRVPKFVNLDMESYQDLDLTIAAFRKTLEKEEFLHHKAGIVLQSYLPDSCNKQRALTAWAKKRTEEGGSPIVIRLVKGANMEMEKVEAAIHGWPLAPYDNKQDVDANFKRMIAYGTEPENIQSVHLGVASHNLFDLAFAYVLTQQKKVSAFLTFEMLEGMADHVRRAIQENYNDIVLYAPVAKADQFINAIAYLIRRLDENTGEENFLRNSCNTETTSEEWQFLKEQFIAACYHLKQAGHSPHRVQDRRREISSHDHH